MLTLDSVGVELHENFVLRHCPNLHELLLCGGGVVDARLDFSDYHARDKPLPTLNGNWNDVLELSKDLSNTNNKVTKCFRWLRVRFTKLRAGWDSISGTRYQPRIKTDLEALLHMLAINRELESPDVVVPPEYTRHIGDFKKRHLTPINRARSKFPMEAKIASLSVLSSKSKAEDANKKIRCGSSQSLTASGDLDQHVLSNIFTFAAPPVLRQVYFRNKADDEDQLY